MQGKTAAEQNTANPPAIDFVNTQGLGGLYAWRKINALFSGKIAVAIAPEPPAAGEKLEAVKARLAEAWQNNRSSVQRDSEDKLEYAVLIAQRATYLSQEGVIDPDVYRPGELTRTLCTPWTYDFRDCRCFYWASNKPDVISGEDNKYPYLNFQRKNWQRALTNS